MVTVFDMVFYAATLGLMLVLVGALLPGILGMPARSMGETILVISAAVTASLLAAMIGL